MAADIGELTGLHWEDVDFDEGTIHIDHTLVYFSRGKQDGCTFAFNTPKTEAGKRTIPMLPIVRTALLKEKAYQEEIGIRCRAQINDFTDFIFVNRFGNVQHHGTLNKALKRIIRDCNCKEVTTLPNFSNHSLRHTFTTRMCEAGVNIKAMQDILGHADVETTLGIYADATKELKAKEMSGFDEYFKELTAGKDA